MHDFMRRVSAKLAWIANLALWLSAAGLVLMTIFIGWQIFGRFVLNDSPVWTEPVAILLMSWFIFLGSAVGIREGYHMSFDILIYMLPRRGRVALYTVSDLILIAFGLGMLIYGSQMAVGTWKSTMPALGVPGGFPFLALVAGGALTVIFSLERIALRMAGMPTAGFGETIISGD